MKELILDASVAIKWFVEEEGTKKSRDLLKAHKSGLVGFYVPQIFFFEIINILSFRAGISNENTRNFLNVIFSLGMKSEAVTREFLNEVLELSRKFRISAYDASYIALAQLMKLNFLTADKKLKGKVKLPFVKLL